MLSEVFSSTSLREYLMCKMLLVFFLSCAMVFPYEGIGIFACFLSQVKPYELREYIPFGYCEGLEIT